MKKAVLSALVVAALAGTASAQVRLELRLVRQTGTPANPGASNQVTNVDIDNDDLSQDESGDNFIDVAPNTPGYFILKFGKGQGITADMFFFQNDPDLTKLVWNDSQITDNGGKSEAISHYAITTNVTTTDNPTTDDVPTTGGPGDVPEPALLSLLGAGLVGAAARLRKKA